MKELDVKGILDKYDIYSDSFKENNWILNQDTGGTPSFIDVDKYWNFPGTVSPRVEVEFCVGTKEDDQGDIVPDWFNINDVRRIRNGGTYNKTNHNNYFVSANITDHGTKELDLVLFDRNFTDLQSLITTSIAAAKPKSIEDMNEGSYDKQGKLSVTNSEDGIQLFKDKNKVTTNIRIRYGYNENSSLRLREKQGYRGFSKNTNSGLRETTTIDKDNVKYYPRWRTTANNVLNDVADSNISDDNNFLHKFQQATLLSTWDEFFIIGLSTTLTETGIKYNIKAVSSETFKLNGYKMLQQYSVISGKPKSVLASMMNTFNSMPNPLVKLVWADPETRASSAVLNGEEISYDYETGTYKSTNEDVVRDKKAELNAPINSMKQYLSLLQDVCACITKIYPNNIETRLCSPKNVEYSAFGDGLSLEENLGYKNTTKISLNKKSYMDLICWPLSGTSYISESSKNKVSSSPYMFSLFANDMAYGYEYLLDALDNKNSKSDEKTIIDKYSFAKSLLGIIGAEVYGVRDTPKLSPSIEEYLKARMKEEEATEEWLDDNNNIDSFNTINNNIPISWKYQQDVTLEYVSGEEEIKNNFGYGGADQNSLRGVDITKEYKLDSLSLYDIVEEYESGYKFLEINSAKDELRKIDTKIFDSFCKALDVIEICYKSRAIYNENTMSYSMVINQINGLSDSSQVKKIFSDLLTDDISEYVKRISIENVKKIVEDPYLIELVDKKNKCILKINNIEVIEYKKKDKETCKKYMYDHAACILNACSAYLLCACINERYQKNNEFDVDYNLFHVSSGGGSISKSDTKKINITNGEYKNFLSSFKEKHDIFLEKVTKSDSNIRGAIEDKKKAKEEIGKGGDEKRYLNVVIEDEIENNLDLSSRGSETLKKYYTGVGRMEEFCSGFSEGNAYVLLWKYLSKPDILKINKVYVFLQEKISKLTKELNRIQKQLSKLNESNIGKEINLSLGSQESRNKEKKLTKTLSSLFTNFCSQCPPKSSKEEYDLKKVDNKDKKNVDATIIDENGEEQRVDTYVDLPKYHLTWNIVGYTDASESIPIVGFYYKKPKAPDKLRYYCWGTGNPKQHCIKSLSIASGSEFAMMQGMKMANVQNNNVYVEAKEDGCVAEYATAGVNPDHPSFFNQISTSSESKNTFDNMVNSICKGSITLLGDPSLKFRGEMQPFVCPIYIQILLQGEQKIPVVDNNSSNINNISHLSGYYIISGINHSISKSGYTTTLEVMRYPGSNSGFDSFSSNSKNKEDTNKKRENSQKAYDDTIKKYTNDSNPIFT